MGFTINNINTIDSHNNVYNSIYVIYDCNFSPMNVGQSYFNNRKILPVKLIFFASKNDYQNGSAPVVLKYINDLISVQIPDNVDIRTLSLNDIQEYVIDTVKYIFNVDDDDIVIDN